MLQQSHMDEENQKQQHAHLDNGTVQSLSWAVKSVSVRDRKSKARKNILSNIEGSIESGQPAEVQLICHKQGREC